MIDDLLEVFEERAAIMEYDGEMSREEAEAAAASSLRAYRYRLTESDTWYSVIAPGCSIDDAWYLLRNKFGEERVVEVEPA
jgi:hypothetical protein